MADQPGVQESIEDDVLYAAIRKIADIAFEYFGVMGKQDQTDNRPSIVDWRQEKVHPLYNQTESGLFLESYYGMPTTLWTPWGKWNFGGDGYGHHEPIAEIFLQRLGATVHESLRVTQMAGYGPVYALHRVDGVPLPEPKVRRRQDFLEYEVARDAWERMTARYNASPM